MFESASQEILFGITITTGIFLLILGFLVIVLHNYVKVKGQKESAILFAVFQSEERERNRIAEEIHDDIGSKISILKFTNEFIRAEKDLSEVQEYARKNSISIDELANQIRDICRDHATKIIVANGLTKQISLLIDATEKAATVAFELNLSFNERSFTPEFTINLFRIIQELTNNSLKHSQCTTISLTVVQKQEAVTLKFKDNGIGISKTSKSNGMGMSNIAGRISAHSGRQFRNTPLKGFETVIEFPMNDRTIRNESINS